MTSTSQPAQFDERLRYDFEAVVRHLGRVPTRDEYEKYGKYSVGRLSYHLDSETGRSYTRAVRALGYTPVNPGILPDEDVRADFERVKDKLGHVPSREEYLQHGTHSLRTFTSRFDPESGLSFNRAVRNLGYDPAYPSVDIPREQVKRDFDAIVDELGRVPTVKEYRDRTAYSMSTLKTKFGDGTYGSAVDALGYGNPNTIATENLRTDLDNVAAKLGRQPTREEYDEHGTFGVQSVVRQLGEDAFADR